MKMGLFRMRLSNLQYIFQNLAHLDTCNLDFMRPKTYNYIVQNPRPRPRKKISLKGL